MATDKEESLAMVNRAHAARIKAEEYVRCVLIPEGKVLVKRCNVRGGLV